MSATSEPAMSHPSRTRRAVVLALGAIAVAAPLFDAVRLCAASWWALIMRSAAEPVPTPSLDALGSALTATWRGVLRALGPLLHDPSWRPGTVILLAIAWSALMALLLHGRR